MIRYKEMLRRIGRWLKAGMLLMLALLVVAAMIGAAYQAKTSAEESKIYHPEGKLVDIGGGRRMHLLCEGSGSPTVLLETGLGSPAIHWRSVFYSVNSFARVCSYDRAGYGYSDAAPAGPRTTDRIVDDLEKLLAAAGEKGPYLLVGHSFGGFTIRAFAARHRADVTGLIFVDSSHPEQKRRMDQEGGKRAFAGLVLAALPVLNRVGALRAISDYTHVEPELRYLQSQPKYVNAVLGEWNAFDESASEVIAESPSFGDLPILALTAGVDGNKNPHDYDVWRNQLQLELAHLSTKGRQVIVEGSTHMIPLEKPQAIVDGIRQMLSEQKAQR